jgi:hypothetical protein
VFVKVEAEEAGEDSNVLAGALTVMPTSLTGIDGTANPYAITNGAEAETNAALLSRFQDFIAGLSRGSEPAVSSFIAGVQSDLIFTILENKAPDGVTTQYGHFVVVISDSEGNLSTELYDEVYDVIREVKPLTSTFSVVPPTVLAPGIEMVLSIDPDAPISNSEIFDEVQLAIYNSFVGSPAGSELVFWELVRIAKSVEYVTDILYLTVDGDGFDSVDGSYATVGAGPANVTAAALELIRPSMANIVIS